MAWWIWGWLTLMLLLSISGIHRDLLHKKPAWYAACGLSSRMVCLYAVATRFGLLALHGSPHVLFLVMLTTAIWLLYENVIEAKDQSERDGDTPFLELGHIVMIDILFMPAIAFGIIDAIDLLRGAA
jgi:hypothetical protein